jgi:hypothetical protein
VVFKVFGGDTEAQKTTTTSTSTTAQPRTRAPPRIDWESPGNAWRNHHNDEPYGDHRQTADVAPPQYGNRVNHAHPSTQRPLFVNNGGGGGTAGFTVNKPTKKTSECKATLTSMVKPYNSLFHPTDDYDTRQNEVIKTEELTYNNNSSSISHCLSHSLILVSLVIAALSRIY